MNAATANNKNISKACLLPAVFAPLLLGADTSPTKAWTLLRATAEAHNLLTACRPLWDWLCGVGATANATCRVDVLLPVAGTPSFRETRAKIQQTVLGNT